MDIYADGVEVIGERIFVAADGTRTYTYTFYDGCCTLTWVISTSANIHIDDKLYIEGTILSRNKVSLEISVETLLPIDKIYF